MSKSKKQLGSASKKNGAGGASGYGTAGSNYSNYIDIGSNYSNSIDAGSNYSSGVHYSSAQEQDEETNYAASSYNTSILDDLDEDGSHYGFVYGADESYEQSYEGGHEVDSSTLLFSITSSVGVELEQKEREPTYIEIEAEKVTAKAQYQEYLDELELRRSLAERQGQPEEVFEEEKAEDSPYAMLDLDLDEEREFSISSSLAFDTQEALQWYREKNDVVIQTAKANSLMGWQKDESGGWTQSGQAPEARGVATEMHGKHTTFHQEHLDAKFRRNLSDSQKLMETEGGKVVGHNTRYFNEEEQAQAEVGVRDGKLVGADGKNVDTTSASGTGTFFEGGAGRFIFHKDVEGTLRATGAWEGHTEMQRDAWYDQAYGRQSSPEDIAARDENELQMSFMNHSSLNAGGDSRGAGELLVEDGDVKMVTDNSGHYRTNNEGLYDTVLGLANQGAATEGMAVGMVNKDQTDKEERLKAIKRGGEETQGRGARLGDLTVGANEFLSYGGAADAEQRMRGAREAREPMMQAINGFDPSALKKTTTNDRSGPDLQSKGGRVDLMRERFEKQPTSGGRSGPGAKKKGGNVSALRARFEQMGHA